MSRRMSLTSYGVAVETLDERMAVLGNVELPLIRTTPSIGNAEEA